MTRQKQASKWFDVDKDGLRVQTKEQIGSPRALVEQINNSLDEQGAGVNAITVTARLIPGKPLAEVSVEDNSPSGYGDFLHHSYTMFAPSKKRGNVGQSGRFNFGCKQWLSLCRNARISTVTGTVTFEENGDRTVSRRTKRRVGTLVEGVMDMTREDFADLQSLVLRLIVPASVTLTFNGQVLPSRTPRESFKAKLTTMVAGANDIMRKVTRETVVDLYDPLEGETPSIYELAVPVVETDIRWIVRVGQKIPQNRDRDNVPPAFLRELKRAVADHMASHIGEDDATGWCNDVLSDEKASRKACDAIVRGKFGDNAAIFDPTDHEANVNWQTAHDGTLVHGRNLTKDQWKNVRRHGLLDPAGVLAPSPKAYSDDPNAPPAQFLDESHLTPGMIKIREHAKNMALGLGVSDLIVHFALNMNLAVRGCYSRLNESSGVLQFNLRVLGQQWFAEGVTVWVDELVIHELAHHFIRSHTHRESCDQIPGGHFYDACCYVAAKALEITRGSVPPVLDIELADSLGGPAA